MEIAARRIELFVLNMRTRIPFRFGITTLTALPHLIVRGEFEVGGKVQAGYAADGLSPKWFTKNPATGPRQDIEEMLAVIRRASELALETSGESLFGFWRELYEKQKSWASGTSYPPLLWSFGVSLVERAAIDAFCRARGRTFGEALQRNDLGVRLGEVHPELSGMDVAGFLPQAPLRTLSVRHTVGLSDPLTEGEIASADRVDDGLPQSLEASIRAYGLTHFKVKLWGEIGRDIERLRAIAAVLERAGAGYALTLDGNENYRELGAFRELWQRLCDERSLGDFLRRVIFVEQPLHREVALAQGTCAALRAWADRPAIIIDESDDRAEAVRIALAGGYVGTSHKNCKGVFKGVANACLIAQRNRAGGRHILSAEDLGNVGPVALLEDLAVIASLGIGHAERNGQHYFRGLSAFPLGIQEQTLAAHSDLYQRHEQGFATLKIRDGAMALGSVIEAPFGVALEPHLSQLTPLSEWRFSSLGLGD